MRKMKLIFSLFFILAIITPVTAGASCNWQQQTVYPPIYQIPSVVGCLTGDTLSNNSFCTQPKPADSFTNESSNAGKISYVCCCAPEEEVATSVTKPKYTLPEFAFQVAIPDLKFSTVECGDTCEIPWISEYVFGVYGYLLTIAGILAVVMLMAAGLLWIISGGDSGKVEQAKKMITGSITGLLLLVSMTLLLNYINPDFIKSKAIKLDTVKKYEAVENGSDSQSNAATSDCPTASSLTNISGIVSLSGVSDPRLTVAAADALKKAADIAAKQGLKLLVTSANRNYAKQKELWDAELIRQGGNEVLTRKYVANPSNCAGKCAGHCAGIAVDICIQGTSSCGKIGGQSNARYSDANVVKLKNIMESAGWRNYVNEWWHFQYN